jgi:hypothetical protein
MPYKTTFATLVLVLLLTPAAAPAQNAVNPRPFIEPYVLRSINQINSAQYTWAATGGTRNFGSLQDLFHAGLIDEALASGSKYGYTYSLTTTPFSPGPPPTYARFTLTVTPRIYRKTGVRSYFMDELGELRAADKRGLPADENDPYIESCFPAGEECAVSGLRWLYGAEQTWLSTNGSGRFYGTLQQLAEARLIRQLMASGPFSGYEFTVTSTPRTTENPATLRITAVPQQYGVTGFKSFFMDESAVIRGADRQGGPANQDDPPIDQ